jgi:hypothetical protein
MNWSRGLFGIWVAISILWVIVVGVFLYAGRLENPAWPSAPHGLPDLIVPIAIFLAMVAVPAGLFIVGWLCLSIGRAFRRR